MNVLFAFGLLKRQSENDNSDDDVQYLGIQAKSSVFSLPSIDNLDDGSTPSEACAQSSIEELASSDSNELEDIDKLLSQQMPFPLVSLSQNDHKPITSLYCPSYDSNSSRCCPEKDLPIRTVGILGFKSHAREIRE